MRPGLAIVAALLLALAACSVNVEGAPCGDAVGTDELCPPGQACGLDGKCSTRAAGCIAPALRCALHEKRCSPQGERVETCTASDPCGAWEALAEDPVCSDGLACSAATGAPRCECPAFAGPEFAADPVAGSPAGAAPFATGAAAPPQCRFRSLADAIARAGQVAGAAAVRAYGASAAPVVFDATTGDGRVTIPANVAVIGATGPTATVLRAAAAAGSPAVTLQGALERFDVEATGSGAAVATACGGATPSLESVAVDGGGTVAIGVDVSGACGATLTSVDVANVAGPALYVHADPSAVVGVHGGSLRSSRVGARVTGGKVALGAQADATALEIAGNLQEGVLLEQGAAVDAQLWWTRVFDNGGTGVVVNLVTAGSAVALKRCAIHGNGATTARVWGGGAPQRPAGGILVVQDALPFEFVANQVWKNAGDQLVFDSADQGWDIGASACGFETSVFACPATPGGLAVAVNGGKVAAANVYWPGIPVAQWMSAQGVTASPYCNNQPGYPVTPPCP